MRTRLALAAGTAALALVGSVFAASPALAAPCATAGCTDVTFSLTAGSLSIAVPASATLASGATSTSLTSVTGQLGSTTVTDTRGALVAAYVVNLSSGNFTTGAAGPTETIVGSTVTAFSACRTSAPQWSVARTQGRLRLELASSSFQTSVQVATLSKQLFTVRSRTSRRSSWISPGLLGGSPPSPDRSPSIPA